MMSRIIRSWMLWMAVFATLLWTGCTSRTTTPSPERKSDRSNVGAKPGKAKTARPEGEDKGPARGSADREAESTQPVAPPTIPAVVLTEELRAACLVNVGDRLPDADLSDLHGKTVALHSLYGKKLTVVCFWTIGPSERSKLLSVALLRDLMKCTPKPGGDQDVALVGVNVGDSAEAVQQQVKQAEATFPNLLDPEGKLLAKVAKDDKTPRIFLLDPTGRILWFDLENSRESRRNLLQAIQVTLGKK